MKVYGDDWAEWVTKPKTDCSLPLNSKLYDAST